jgi:lipopolysaccharide export system permease protein
MHSSPTLSRYVGRQFLVRFCLLLLILLGIVLLLDMVELLRRGSGKPGVTFGLIFEMALLKLPQIGQQIFPFVVLFAAMFTFWRLTRSNELVVARAIGLSAWQFLTPVLVVAFMVGVVRIAVINPLGAVFVARYDQLEERYLKMRSNTFDISKAGLWLRQTRGGEQIFLHAEAVRPDTMELRDVAVFRFDARQNFTSRISAPRAVLKPGHWDLSDATVYRPRGVVERAVAIAIPTDLDMRMIEESYAPPETVPFWELPHFIRTLESTGFPAVRHRLHFQALLAQPLLFCAMVLFAAAFSLRLPRRGGTLIMVTGGVLTGFMLFVATDIIRTLGMSETIPVAMAAWAPAGISVLLAIAVLLHLEDG